MAKLIRLKNQIVDLDAIRYAAFVPAGAHRPAPSTLHLIISGVAVDLDQDDDADRLWEIITERLQIDWIDGPKTDVLPLSPDSFG
jgi:hypothetical protein